MPSIDACFMIPTSDPFIFPFILFLLFSLFISAQYIALTFSSGISFSYLEIFIFHLTSIVLSVTHVLRVGPWILHLTALSNRGCFPSDLSISDDP